MSSAAEPRVPVATRALIPPAARRALPRQQLAWALGQGLCLTALLAWPTTAAWADLVWASALGLGVAMSLLRRPLRALSAFALVLGGSAVAGAFGDGSASVSLLLQPELAAGFSSRGLAGAQVLAAGAAAGLALGLLDGQGREGLRLLQLTLAGAATAGLGWWAAEALVPPSWRPLVALPVGAAISALLASQVLLVAALRFRSADRIPSPRRIKATLSAAYQEPSLRAWRLDQRLAGQSPDPETRDGLGEVAAWVYRLEWTLQRLDRELEEIDQQPLAERIAALEAEAAALTDPFTKERKLATADHLRQLEGHRDALAAERARTAALSGYAGAFLEEARAGLVLARVQPGEHAPTALDDVLERLRAHGAEGEARRRSAREINALS